MITGTPAVTDQNIAPVSTASCSEEFIVMATARKDYRLRRGALYFIRSIQETNQFASFELVL